MEPHTNRASRCEHFNLGYALGAIATSKGTITVHAQITSRDLKNNQVIHRWIIKKKNSD